MRARGVRLPAPLARRPHRGSCRHGRARPLQREPRRRAAHRRRDAVARRGACRARPAPPGALGEDRARRSRGRAGGGASGREDPRALRRAAARAGGPLRGGVPRLRRRRRLPFRDDTAASRSPRLRGGGEPALRRRLERLLPEGRRLHVAQREEVRFSAAQGRGPGRARQPARGGRGGSRDQDRGGRVGRVGLPGAVAHGHRRQHAGGDLPGLPARGEAGAGPRHQGRAPRRLHRGHARARAATRGGSSASPRRTPTC